MEEKSVEVLKNEHVSIQNLSVFILLLAKNNSLNSIRNVIFRVLSISKITTAFDFISF